MALNPQYFALKSGLLSVWNNTTFLSPEHKALITSAIPGTTATEPPSAEWQLDKIHGAINATEFLNTFEANGTMWVTPHAKQVPSAFRKFVHDVALYFHRSGLKLPDPFADHLSSFILATKSHVATLNYDNLLYDALIEKKVLHGFDCMLDGFLQEYSEANLHRFYENRQCYYLHLHGSPLYIDNCKRTGAARAFLGPAENNHIVLTHVQHKPFFIDSSPILSTYWRYLDVAINESQVIFLVGYSGEDWHLNNLLRLRNDRHVAIVEWEGAGTLQARVSYWAQILARNTNFRVYLRPSIFDFNDWHLQQPIHEVPLLPQVC